MPDSGDGFERAFGMVIEAIVVAVLFSAFVEAGLIPKIYFTLFNLISIVGLILLIEKAKYWGFGYLAGWILGLVFSLGTLIQTEFIGLFDLFLYGAVAAGTIYVKIKVRI